MDKIALFDVTETQKKETIEKVINVSSPVPSYTLLLVLSIIIVTIGLILNSPAVVIGGMLVSPLLSPLASLSMGVVISDMHLIYRSMYVFGRSMAFVFLISLVLALLLPIELNYEILSRSEPTLMYLYVALASGVAAAFSFIRKEFEERLVGVAIAIAVLPPLAVTAIGVGVLNREIISGSLQLFAVNIVGILLAMIIVFSLFGFHTARKEASAVLAEEEKELKEYHKEQKEQKEELRDSVNGKK